MISLSIILKHLEISTLPVGNSKRCSNAFLREKRVEGTKNPVSIIRAKKKPWKVVLDAFMPRYLYIYHQGKIK